MSAQEPTQLAVDVTNTYAFNDWLANSVSAWR